jgi:hypothetical protein
MEGNGADRYAAIAARLDALEAAHRVLLRMFEEQYRPRLLAVEADVDRIARELAELLNR